MILAALLAAAVVAVYWQARNFGFVAIDDGLYVTENVHVPRGLNLENLKWSFGFHFHDDNWLPLTWLSLMLDTDLSGSGPRGYHTTNVLLHVANTVVLFLLLARATGESVRSAFVAGLFGLHPLHVESVAWIAERKDVLSTLFGLASLWAYVEYALRTGPACALPESSPPLRPLRPRIPLGGGGGGGFVFLGISFLCLAASLMSKSTLVTLPCVFLLFDLWPLRRRSATRARLVWEKIPLFLLSVVFSAVAIIAQRSGNTVAALGALSFSTRCANALVAYVAYLGQTFFPFHLAVYYPHPGDRQSAAVVMLAAGLLATISLVAIASWRRRASLFVGWSWYLGTLVPMIGLIQVGNQQMADRYTYFPLIGIFLAVAWLVPSSAFAGSTVRSAGFGLGAAAILAAVATATYVQAGYWRDNVSLFRHAIESTEENPLAESGLGYALLAGGKTAEGVAYLESAARKGPWDPQTHYVLAIALQATGRLDEAADHYRRSLALNEHNPEAHTNLAVILAHRRMYDEAKAHFLRALEIDPEYADAYVNLGSLSVETRQYGDAIGYSQRALSLNQRLVQSRWNLALALRALGRLDEAIQQFEQYLAASPGDQDAKGELARTRAMKSNRDGISARSIK